MSRFFLRRGRLVQHRFRSRCDVPVPRLDRLEDRRLLAVSVSLSGGVVTFTDDTTAPIDTALSLRVGGTGLLEYSVNGSPFSSDLDTAAAGDQTATVASLSAINIDLGTGDDYLNLATFVGLGVSVEGGSGDDVIVGSPQADSIDGGAGDDLVIGGAGLDLLSGGADDDVIDGDAGADQMLGNGGDDTIIWDPGDGSDLVEGGAGLDTMAFNGSAGNEIFTFNAVGSRLEFLRNLGNIDMDVDDVERVDVNRDATFTATLDQDQEVPDPPVFSTATGSATFRYNTLTGTFDLDLFVQGLTGPIAASHLHVAPPGDFGGIIVDLGGQADYFAEGTGFRRVIRGLAFPQANVDDLLAGNVYINVHTPNNPAGEIRGQLVIANANPIGADTFIVNDVSATDVTDVNLNLGPDGASNADSVVVHGTDGRDKINVSPNGDAVNVSGLAYDVSVLNSDPESDLLTVMGNDGRDMIKARPGLAALIELALFGGAGNDHLFGGDGDDLLDGGEGNDHLFGRRGDDMLIGGPGRDKTFGNQGADTIA